VQLSYVVAVVAATIVVSLSDWLFFGVLFHDRYDETPEVWRTGSEGPRIAASTVSVLVGAIAFFVIAAGLQVRGLRPALMLALLVWLAGSLPQTFMNTLYIKYSPSIGVSHSLGWLARALIVGAAYGVVTR
jgi:Protein of unknown function (DUF1761)